MASALRLMLALLLCSIAALAAQPPDVLKQADSDFCQATRAKGLDGWMSWFADNGSLPQMTPPVQGKAALRAFYQSLFDHKDLEFRWAPDHAELFPAGNLGYTSGRYAMSFTGADGKRVARSGSYLTVWQKQSDNSWKVLSDFGVPDPAPAR